MTTEDYLTQLQQDREDLVDNLETQGITGLTGDETFTELVPEVLNISSGGEADLNEYFVTEITQETGSNNYFQPIIKFPDVYVSNNVTALTYAFKNYSLNVIPKIHCNNNIINIIRMFDSCSKVVSIDLSDFDGSNLEHTAFAFTGCTSLMYLDIRKMEFTNVTSFVSMFGSSSSNYVPADCEIIVKSNTEKQWIMTNFSRLTNVKTVAELEAE